MPNDASSVRPIRDSVLDFFPIVRVSVFLTILISAVATPFASSAPNRVLELDGQGSYVELPPNVFNTLTQATVEVWVKWNAFQTNSRVVEFGAPWHSIALLNEGASSTVRFNNYPRYSKRERSPKYYIRGLDALKTNEWTHFAIVTGLEGMKLYMNGHLIGKRTNTTSFADIKINQTYLIGRSLTALAGDKDFFGQIDELRVWDRRRLPAQIRDKMRKRLTGRETGLVALWNFDDGKAVDRTSHHYRGKLIGNARIVVADGENDSILIADEAAPKPQPTVAPPAPAIAVTVPAPPARSPVAWWIAGALTLIAVLLGALIVMLRRSGVGKDKLLPATPSNPLLTDGPSGSSELKDRALAQLTEFAKESLVQGLYSQRKALLETQMKAQQELAEMEARLAAVKFPERISAYENRIAELEKELESRTGELRELTKATLELLRQRLETEKQTASESRQFN